MENSNPYWYNIIDYWISEMGREGLTIPFVIGAQKYLPEHNSIDIQELVDEIIVFDNEKIITLFYCDTIGENVLGMISRNSKRYGKFFSNSENRTSLIVSDSLLSKGVTPEDIIHYLEEKYNGCVEAGNFSFNKGKWEPSTQFDVSMIEKAFD